MSECVRTLLETLHEEGSLTYPQLDDCSSTYDYTYADLDASLEYAVEMGWISWEDDEYAITDSGREWL